MRLIERILSIYIYGSFHVAIGATAYTLFTYSCSNNTPDWNYLFFVLSATLLLYSIHKVFGKEGVKNFSYHERIHFSIQHIRLFVLLGFLGAISSLFFFYQLSSLYQINLILPSLLSLAYSLPLFKGKRLRDFSLIKIFLIAISWSIVCVYIPLSGQTITMSQQLLWTISSSLFIFAITLPFDIRDFEIDKYSGTITIPTKYGILNSIKLSKLLLGMSLILMIPVYHLDIISGIGLLSLAITYGLGVFTIEKTSPNSPKFYISGLIEGLLLLPIILYWVIQLAQIPV